jgi:uncharacterized membrane protein
MSRFHSVLSQTGDRLSLPKATKSLILVEIAADLEDLFQHYLQQGLSEEEAAARAEEKVDMSDDALVELVQIHSDARGWTGRISRRAQPFWERLAMAAIVVFLFAITILEAELPLILARTSVFVWPVLAIFVALVVSSIVQGIRLSGRSNLRRLRADLATPLFFGGASLVVGFGGFAIDLYLALRRMVHDPENAPNYLARAFLGGTSTLMIAFLVALCSALAWFIFSGRVARLEQDAVKTLLEV